MDDSNLYLYPQDTHNYYVWNTFLGYKNFFFKSYKTKGATLLIFTAHKLSCGKVMFSQASVHGGVHVTINHDALELTVQGPTPSSPEH